MDVIIPSNYFPNTEKRRINFSKKVIIILKTFYMTNQYPSKEEKIFLSNETGLSYKSVDQWFINARRRLEIVNSIK
jgi:hypothetical protein